MNDSSNVQPDLDSTNSHLEVVSVFGVRNKKTQNLDDALIEYADALEAIDENNPLAKLNAMSMSDNNGGRIFF